MIDSSITLAWVLFDEMSAAADTVFSQVGESGAVAPSLWRLEVANGLQMAMRRKRIKAAFRDAVIVRLQALSVAIDTETDYHAWAATLQLADRHSLTLYDAAYLELALRLGLPLATLDQALYAAGAAQGISVLGLSRPG